MKRIPLTKGLFALVDDCDFDALNQFKWHASKHKNTFYAKKVFRNLDGTKAITMMHRALLSPKESEQVDHADRDGLNNCRTNLRICTYSENNKNRRIFKNNTSGYRGVIAAPNGRFYAQIYKNGRCTALGGYGSILQAAEAYEAAAKRIYGDFAKQDWQAVPKCAPNLSLRPNLTEAVNDG